MKSTKFSKNLNSFSYLLYLFWKNVCVGFSSWYDKVNCKTANVYLHKHTNNFNTQSRHKADTNFIQRRGWAIMFWQIQKHVFLHLSNRMIIEDKKLHTNTCQCARTWQQCKGLVYDDTCFKVINRIEICIPLTDWRFGDAILHVVFLDEINVNFFLHLHNKFAL